MDINKNYVTVNWDQNKLQKFVALLIVGYFGVKIFYGFFNKYSKKPSRDEMIDFSVMMVMASILYILTNMNARDLLGTYSSVNWAFFLGYLLGLNIPFIFDNMSEDGNIQNNYSLQIFFYTVFIFLMLTMIYLSIKSSKNGGNVMYYIMYLVVIALMMLGLIMTRRRGKIYKKTKKIRDNEDIYLDEHMRDMVEVKGTSITFGVAMIGWLLSLLFMYESNDEFIRSILTLTNGVTLGMFVSGVAFYGFEYLIRDRGEKDCSTEEDCKRKGMIVMNEGTDVMKSLSTIKWVLVFTIFTLILVIIMFYMVRDY